MNKLIFGGLIACCMILSTASGSVFARKLAEEGDRDVYLENVNFDMIEQDKKTENKHTVSHTSINDKKEDLNEEPGDYLQSLIMAPMAIMKTIGDNPVIISK